MKRHWIRLAFVLVAAVLAALLLAGRGGSGTVDTAKPSRKGEVIALKTAARSGYAVRHARCADRLSDF